MTTKVILPTAQTSERTTSAPLAVTGFLAWLMQHAAGHNRAGRPQGYCVAAICVEPDGPLQPPIRE
jgi:hypothetical protein